MKRSWWIVAAGIFLSILVISCGSGGGSGDSSTYTVGGTVSGLANGTSIVIQLNGGDNLTVTGDADGVVTFTFPTPLENGSEYEVTVLTQPGNGRVCAVANGSGTVSGANATSVRVNGQLDAGFSTDGIALGGNAAGAGSNDYGYAIAIDGDGKILVVGESENTSGDSDMVIWRYNADGTLDTTFSGDGIVTYDGSDDDAGYSIALDDASGDILVTGLITNGSGNYDMAIWRYTSTGAPDGAFGGGDGLVTYNNSGYVTSSDTGKFIMLAAGGNILVAGASQSEPSNSDLTVWCYDENGAPVNAFGASGVAMFDSGFGNDEAFSLALADGGKILVAGTRMNAEGNLDMVLMRLTAIGGKDMPFGGGDGIVGYNGSANGNDAGFSMVRDGAGNILVAGYSLNASGNADMAIWRFTAAGVGDTTFSGDGIALSHNAAGGNGSDYAFFITLDEDGKILVTGASAGPWGYPDMVLWRFAATGLPDTDFGLNGIIATDSAAGGDYYDFGSGIAIDPDDADEKIVVSGYSVNASDDFDMVAWRFFP